MMLTAIAGVAAVVLGGGFILTRGAGSDSAEAEKAQLAAEEASETSIAVLPFISMSASKDDEFFADGLSEELLNVLANIDSLKVAARTSSFYFKGKNEDLRTIGETLGVNHVSGRQRSPFRRSIAHYRAADQSR